MDNLELTRYPVGRYQNPDKISDEDLMEYIRILGDLPAELAKTVENFDDEKFNTQYRENGWTVRQVIYHLAEAHSRAYARFKQALDENNLTVRDDGENKLQDLQHNQANTVQAALQLIYGLHNRWFFELKSFTTGELDSTFFYPDANRSISIRQFLAIFAWHSRHHLGHIKGLKDRMGW